MMALGLLVVPAGTGASVVQSGGVSYVTTKKSVKPHSFLRAIATCPKGTSVVGGGEQASTKFGTIDLRQTSPVDSGDSGNSPDDGWGVGVYNQSSKPSSIRATAACGDAHATYVQKRVPLKAHDGREQDARCPSGLHAYSGGVSSKSSRLRLESTFLAGNHSPSRTWTTDFSAPTELTATAYAVCLKPAPQIPVADVSTPLAGAEAEAHIFCFGSTRAYGASFRTNSSGKVETINSLGLIAPTASIKNGGGRVATDFTENGLGMELKLICGPKL
jgi:hypothetical protein